MCHEFGGAGLQGLESTDRIVRLPFTSLRSESPSLTHTIVITCPLGVNRKQGKSTCTTVVVQGDFASLRLIGVANEEWGPQRNGRDQVTRLDCPSY
jgi:hypothetical protein